MDGRNFAAQVKPLDASGVFDPVNGKIVVLGLGMSSWTDELCHGVNIESIVVPLCSPASFFTNVRANRFVNNKVIVFIDCAANAATTIKWIDDSLGLYTRCSSILGANNVTEKQVQVILWMNADGNPTVPLSPSIDCSKISAITNSTPDACKYEHYVAEIARFVKIQYPNIRQIFLHSRRYGGYATTHLNPEPYAYEYGFGTKWLIQAQIDQVDNGTMEPNTGDLSYTAAPWLGWGPYFWADGALPRSDGLETTWNPVDYVSDGTHPSTLGVQKVTLMMMHFYLNSPYSPWFVAPSAP